MVFDLNNWNTVSSGGRRGDLGGSTFYSFITSDSPLTVHQDGYFDLVRNRLAPGDIISARYEDPSDNLTEMMVVGEAFPIVTITEILPSSQHQDGFSMLLPDASLSNTGTMVVNSLFRQFIRVSVVINTGSITTNATQFFLFLNGFSSPITPFLILPAGSVVGDSISGTVDGTLITLPGLNKIEIRTNVTPTTTPAQIGCFIETLVVPNK